MITQHARPSEPVLAPSSEVSDTDVPRRRLSPRRSPVLVVAALCGVYLLLTLLGVTTSSLGTGAMRQDPAHPLGTTIGSPRDIRSDEWQVDTPFLLGLGATGGESVGTPLAERPDLLVGIPASGGVFSSIVEFDGFFMRLGTHLPVSWLFAAQWWLPWLLLLLALPPWLRRLGANQPMSWLATALVVAAPATAWWSGFPVRILGFAVAGSLLGMIAADAFGRRRRLLGTGAAVLGGVLLSRLATWYIPWSITLAVPLVLATLCWLVADRQRRRAGLIAIGVTGAVAIILVAGIYRENWSALMASAHTAYPGSRTSSGAPTTLALLFGAPGDSYFQLGHALTGSNVSELSSAFTFCAVWAFAVYLGTTRTAVGARAWRWRRTAGERPAVDRNTVALGVLTAVTALWLAWCTISFGRVGALLPVLNRVPPTRAAQTVGFLAVLVLCLVLSRRGAAGGWRTPVMAAVASAAVTAYGVSTLQAYAPGIGAPIILGFTAVVFLGVLFVTRRPDRWWPTVGIAVAAAIGVAAANPVQFGVGDLRDSATAKAMLTAGKEARDQGAYWATDGTDTDALLIATGVPTLSGEQITGPDTAGWSRIDPSHRYEDAWNRGGSSIEMTWLAKGSPVVATGAPDQILVQVDPCDLARRGFHLTHVVSRTSLHNGCLTRTSTVRWSGTTRYVYEVSAGSR
jgi:hypothetical protein